MSGAYFVAVTNVFGHSVRVFAKFDGEIQFRVRLSERIVELVACVIKDIHARGPRDCFCNAQARNERLHFVILLHTVRLYARFRSV